MAHYIILIRGVNVGGKNIVSMTALRQRLQAAGFRNVRSYNNSGNILLESDRAPAVIASDIESVLLRIFTLTSSSKVLVLSHLDMQTVINTAPPDFGTQPTTYHSDVIFLLDIKPAEALKVFSPRGGIDQIWAGTAVIYSQRLSSKRMKSDLNKIVGTAAYKSMTIRTWNTVTKLLALLGDPA